MANFIIKLVLGLFIWFLLPQLIYGKHKTKKKGTQFYVTIGCRILGCLIVIFAVIDVIKLLLTF